MKLAFFDLETTGVDPYKDKIVEFALYVPDKDDLYLSGLVNPGIPIPPESTEIHDITDAAVADVPGFGGYADRIQAAIEGTTLVGYNSRTFDTPLLHRELVLAGQAGLPTNELGAIIMPEIDLLKLWRTLETRTLSGAVKRFLHQDRDEEHTAAADMTILDKLLGAMAMELMPLPEVVAGMESVEHTFPDYQEMMRITAPEDEVDRDGMFVKDDEGKIRFGFGKHKGERVALCANYLNWMLGANFSPEVKGWCEKFLGMMPGGNG